MNDKKRKLGSGQCYLAGTSINSVSFQFHSHQIFHCFVIAGAFVHYHGISIMAFKRLEKGDCPMEPVELQCLIDKAYNTVSTAQE